jgi:hypothetical protein
MGMLESMDWDFLQSFLGHYGKVIATGGGLIVAVISLAVAFYRYRRENTIERILGKSADKVQKELEFLEKGKAALNQEELALEYERTQIRLRQQRLDNVRNAFIGKEHDLWCLHAANNLAEHDRRIKRQRQQPK